MQSQNVQSVSKTPELFNGASSFVAAAQAASQQLPSGWEPARARAMTLADYREQLEAEHERALGSAVMARGVSRAMYLRAGDTVQIQRSLDASGTYGLVGVNHEWTADGYTNRFTCTP